MQATLADVKMIWDGGVHQAFTDLIRFRDQWICSFREGAAHASPDGKMRVIGSPDGQVWEPLALLTEAGYDLRDPKLSVTPEGKLMMVGAATVREGNQPATFTQSFVSFSEDGRTWSGLHFVGEEGEWLWRVTWHGGKAYGVAYRTVEPGKRALRLYVSGDGRAFEPVADTIYNRNEPNESTLRFDPDGTAYCVSRCEAPGTNHAVFGRSEPPYTQWTWSGLGRFLGGPNLIQLPWGEWLIGARHHVEGESRTVLSALDVNEGTLRPLLTLPSGGDTSYPGLVWHDGQLWVSYYSKHEGPKVSIYLAQVRLDRSA